MQASTSFKIDIGHLKGRENWQTWRYKVLQLLRGSVGGLDAVEGRLKKPVLPKDATSEEIATFRENLQKYDEADSRALLLLTANMSDMTLQKIMRLGTSKEVWDELHRLFDRSTDDKTYTYSLEFFHYCKDPHHDMGTHISKIKNLWHDLTIELMKEYKCELPEVLLICKILDTLPESFFPFKSSWLLLSKADRNIENLTVQLCNFEKSLANQHIQAGSTEAFATQNSNNKFIKKKCSYCGKLGHKIKKCHKWISDGRPPKPSTPSTNEAKVNTVLMYVEDDQEVNAVSDNDFDSWYVDNGATNHVTNRRDFFTTFESCNSNTLTTANGATVGALGKGNVHLIAFVNNRKQDIILNEVWYVPAIKKNLFSVLAAQDKLNNSVFTSERETCSLKINGQVYLVGKRSKNGGLYKLNAKAVIGNSTAEVNTLSKSSLQLYHERFAHQNKRHVQKVIGQELGIKVPLDSEFCTGCIYGKTHRKKFGTRVRAKEPGEIIHADVCGPFPYSFSKYRYFVLFKDDFSKYKFIYFLKHKSEVCEKLKQMLQESKTAGHTIKELLSDNGGEFDNMNVKKLLQEAGIKQRLTMPYTPQQNGSSERENRTLVEAARSLMYSHEELPVSCWSELVNTAAYVLNRTGPSSVDGKSPHELWFKRKPSIKHLRVIGCECYAHIPKQKRTKLSKKAQKCVLIGYEGDDGYRLLSFNTNDKPTLVRSRDVIFNESALNPIGLDDPEDNQENPSVEVQYPLTTPSMCDAREDTRIVDRCDNSPSLNLPPTSEGIAEPLQEFPDASPQSSPRYEDASVGEDDGQIGTPGNIEDLANESTRMVLRDRSQLKQPQRYHDYAMTAYDDINTIIEPKSYKEAINSAQKDKWSDAMDSEIKSLAENKTWILVDLPKGRKPVSCKWIFKVKTNADGSLDKFKARLVARGYTQKKGIDYDETFSPVAKMTTVRTLLSIAANEGMTLAQFDVSTAFLYGSLNEEIYMNQPDGYNDGSEKVCRLKRSLYGLKQAPRCWNKCMVDYLKNIGFKQCDTDTCLFIRNRSNDKIILALYVDDGLIAASNPKDCDRFMSELKERFKITTKESPYFLGLEIINVNGDITVTQKHYAHKVLDRFGMADCKPVTTPIQKDGQDELLNLVKDSEEPVTFPYREAVGALAYLTVGTRPDLAYAMSVVSRSLENPSKHDIQKLKRILRYIKGTLDYGITYQRNYNSGILDCYSDSDHGGDKTTGRSTSGILCLYSGGAISWSSRRQTCVAISSTEAELVAASEAAREIVWIKRLFAEISNLKEIPILKVDNDAAIKISHNPELHRRTKHIAIRHFYVRELVTAGELLVQYVPTEFQLADLLTKPLHQPKIASMVKHMGLFR